MARDRSGEYRGWPGDTPAQRRKAYNAARGLTGQAAWGHKTRAADAARNAATRAARAARADAGRKAYDAQQRGLKRSQQVGRQTITASSSPAQVTADLRRAARAGDSVSVTVRARSADGTYRQHTLGAASFAAIGGYDAGSSTVNLPDDRATPVGKVQATYGPPSSFAGGDAVPASAILALLDYYDGDVWDLFGDWWDVEDDDYFG